MAYIGISNMIVAKLQEEDEEKYCDGIEFGQAVQLEIVPEYQDTSEYNDMNDTGQSREFAYADIKIITSHVPDMDLTGYVGVGFVVTEKYLQKRDYTAFWIIKAKLQEGTTTYKTKGDTIEYVTPEVSGRAEPIRDGLWRYKEKFKEKEAAVNWLKEKANMIEKEKDDGIYWT